MSHFEWMAWTAPTAIFFAAIAGILFGMTVWEVLSPSLERKGFLPIPTTRGDRLFIGLLSSAFFHLVWIGLIPDLVLLPLWYATILAALWMLVVIRWG